MKTFKFGTLIVFLLLNIYSFCQSHYDSLYVQNIINSELKVRDQRMKKAYPVFEVSALSRWESKPDSVYNQFYFGKEIHWTTFNIKSEYCFFVSDKAIGSCFYIYPPVFNAGLDKFIIRFETRYLDNSSQFITDYYIKKKRKWQFKRSIPSFSF